jgi:hypothetical protein
MMIGDNALIGEYCSLDHARQIGWVSVAGERLHEDLSANVMEVAMLDGAMHLSVYRKQSCL